MAFQKPHTTGAGIPLNYYRISTARIDYATKEASVIFEAMTSAQAAQPAVPVFAKLRLHGEVFDKWFSKAALAGEDVNAQAYRAAKAEGVICDAGASFFADAESA
jgi:hypothetical protein